MLDIYQLNELPCTSSASLPKVYVHSSQSDNLEPEGRENRFGSLAAIVSTWFLEVLDSLAVRFGLNVQ
jgi:hypothetical protein